MARKRTRTPATWEICEAASVIDPGLWLRPQMQTALAAQDFTVVFGLVLDQTGVPQWRLGGWVGLGQSVISKIRRGERGVDTLGVIQRVADGLAMPPHARRLLGLLENPDAPVNPAPAQAVATATPSAGAGPALYDGPTGADGGADIDLGLLWGPGGMPAALEGMVAAMKRRRFFELTGGALAGAAHQWMVADPARIAAALEGRRVDHAAVDDLDRVVDIRRRQDDVLGGRAVYDVVTADLRLTVDLLRHCSYTEAVGMRLYAVVAEQARLAGFAAFDAGNPGVAQRFLLAGLRASHEAGDPALGVGANILREMALQQSTGDPRGAVTLLRSARAHAGPVLTPTEKAVLAGALAIAYAGAGEAGNAAAEIDEAFTQVGRARPEEDPPYMYWATPADISGVAGYALLVSGAPGRAIPHLDSSAAATDRAARPREWVVAQLDLATAHARDGNPEHAVHLGHQAVDLGSTVASGRVARRFADLAREIEATGHPAADLREHAAALLA